MTGFLFLTCGLLVFIYMLEVLGYLQPELNVPISINDIIVPLLAIVVHSILLRSTIHDSERSATDAKQAADALSTINRELEASQDQLRQARDHLEERVARRTRELAAANDQLKNEITERQQSENRFRSLAVNSPDFIFIRHAVQSGWTFFNRDAFLGHAPETLAHPDDFLAIVHPDDQTMARDHWERLTTTTEREGSLEFRFRTKSGAWEWIQSRETILTRDEDGRAANILVTMTVITERKEYEETLRMAKEEAEAATRAKSEFLANMSHEIRTPMNGVVGMLSLLTQSPLTPEQRSYIETIRQSSDSLLTIIDDILDLSKAEFGKLTLEKVPFDVRRCIDDAVDLLAHKAAEQGLELCHFIAPNVPRQVIGDANRLRQILVNILANAVKFTQHGEVELSVEARTINTAEAELCFIVHDTGIGIARQDQETLFLPFNQVDTSNTRRYGGTGLGLAISKHLCELMGGHITVESAPGAGSTFTFSIRVPVVEAETVAYAQHRAGLAGHSALVIESNRAARAVLIRYLTALGIATTEFANIGDALKELPPQAAFDYALVPRQALSPDETQRLLRLQQQNGMKLIRLLSRQDPLDDRKNGENGAAKITATLRKPVHGDQLVRALLDVVTPQPTLPQSLPQIDPISEELGLRYPLRILLAEDNLVNQKVALRMLKRLGYDADVAKNGLEAVDATRGQRYDVIIMDVQMPEMDGLEATRYIRADATIGHQPYIIAMTAAAMQLDREKCLAAGMDDFIAKPARLEDLASALLRYLPAADPG